MISFIIPCYWHSKKLLDMTSECIGGVWDKGEVLVIADKQSYAKNVNKGFKIARGDIIVVLNNDLKFIDPYWLHHLTEPLKEYDICSIRTTEEGWETRDELEEDAKFGSIWAFRREVYDEIGDLDESFGNYFEDLDFHKRATDAGFRVVKNHNGLVEHLGKATFKEIDPKDKQYQRGMELFEKKWGSVW
jgi:GT2 family glycosyltransferase